MEGEKKREGKRGRDGRFFLHKTLFSRLPLSSVRATLSARFPASSLLSEWWQQWH